MKRLKMKNITKLFIILVIPILSFLGITNVHAETVTTGKSTPYYHTAKDSSGYSMYGHDEIIYVDGAYAYCVDPMVKINNRSYYSADINSLTNNDLVMKYAYYGAGYGNHNGDNWYMATQMLIWKAVFNGDVYFTNGLNGSRNDSILVNEMNEIQTLVNQHDMKPNFTNVPSTMNIGQTITVNDANGVLNQYSVANVTNGAASINGNSLSITATNNGTMSIYLRQNAVRFGYQPKLLVSTLGQSGSQTVLASGDVDPNYKSLSIKVYGGDITGHKVDSETGSTPQGEATLYGAVYGVYNSANQEVARFTTDEKGVGKTGQILPLGKYYVKEIKASNGYDLDTKEYPFEITASNLHASVNLPEVVRTNDISILKQYDYINGNTKILTPEDGITFEIYNNQNKVYKTITTDKNGYALVKLPFGTYRFHQTNVKPGYIKASDFNVVVNYETSKTQYYSILNNSLSAYLRVTKKDSSTGAVIALPDTTFRIKNTDTNQYVSQFVGGEVISEFKTNKDGVMTTPLALSAGNYQLEEITPPAGYQLNTTPLKFSIGDNTTFVTTDYGSYILYDFYDAPILGQLTIHKNGEEIVLNNGTFTYRTTNKLANVKYQLVADENIMSSDKKVLFYKKGTVVATVTTDANGDAQIDNLHIGKYKLIEIDAPTQYVRDTTNYPVEITQTDNSAIIYVTKVLNNYLKKAPVEFTKTDLTNGQPVAGATINICTEDGKLVYTGVTDKKGKIRVENLSYGKYYFQEVIAPEGFNLFTERVYFNIKEEGKTVSATMADKPIIGDVKLVKTDSFNGNVIANASFEVYDAATNKKVAEGKSDANGVFTAKGLRYGNYYIIETVPAEGFNKFEGRVNFTIREEGKTVSVSMQDKPITGDVKLLKTDAWTGDTLANVSLEVYNADTNQLVASGKTDAKGVFIAKGLRYGNYYIIEKETIEGFNLFTGKINFSIREEGKTVNVEMKNTPITGKLEFTKTDLFTGKILPNATFEVYNAKTNQLVATASTDNTGKFSLENLRYGKYYIIETEAPEGFNLYEGKVYFSIVKQDKTVYSTMADKPITGNVKFTKTDLFTGKILPNAVIEIHNADTDAIVYSEKTDANGSITVKNLRYGKYYIIETEAPEGFNLFTERVYFNIKEEGKTVSATMADKPITGKLEFTKTDFSNGKALPNAKIAIYNASTKEKVYETTTDKDGKFVSPELRYGKYYVVEVEAPEGFNLYEGKVYFNIKEEGKIVKSSMVDVPITGDLEFTKYTLVNNNIKETDKASMQNSSKNKETSINKENKNSKGNSKDDKTNSDEKEAKGTKVYLANVGIAIYNMNDELVYEGQTDEYGKIKVEGLRYGKYYIVETKALDGYVSSEEKLYFEIKENGKLVKVEMENKPIEGKLKFTKVDSKDNSPLKGALIEIYDENDKLVYSGRTDANGAVLLDGVRYGKYYIVEKEAPEGYEVNHDKIYFEIKEDGKIVSETMKDEKIKQASSYNIPDTNSSDAIEIVVYVVIVIMLIVAYILILDPKDKMSHKKSNEKSLNNKEDSHEDNEK